MSFMQKKIILIVLACVWGLATWIFRGFFIETIGGITVSLLFLIAYCILALKWCRCPHCDSVLWRLSIFSAHCPHCGNELE